MKSFLQKIITSHRFSLISLLFIQWAGFLLQHHLPPKLHILLFVGSSLGFGIALLLVYFNKAIGVSASGQQQGAKTRMCITLIGCAIIGFMFYLLHGNIILDGLAMLGWAIAFILLVARSAKYNSNLYHLLALLFGSGTLLFLCIRPNPLSTIVPDPGGVMLLAYYILLVICLNSNKAVIRGVIMGIGLLGMGWNALPWLLPVLLIIWLNETKRDFNRVISSLVIVAAGLGILFYPVVQSWYKLNDITCTGLLHFPFILTTLSVVAMLILYSRIRKLIDYRIFLMAALKICMALFLLFDWLPFPGLMLVDLFVSIAIFSETGKYHFAGAIRKEIPQYH